jgi:hypothetical protein
MFYIRRLPRWLWLLWALQIALCLAAMALVSPVVGGHSMSGTTGMTAGSLLNLALSSSVLSFG